MTSGYHGGSISRLPKKKKTRTATARKTAKKKKIFNGCPKSSFLYFISLYFSTIGLGKQIISTKVMFFNIIHCFHTFFYHLLTRIFDLCTSAPKVPVRE